MLEEKCEHENNAQSVANETVSETDVVYSSEWLRFNTSVSGWLSFFLFAITAGGLISAVYPIATFNAADYANNLCLGAVDIITGIFMLAVAVYTVFAFTKRKPNAVFWGRIYVILVFLTNIFVLISGSVEDTGLQSASRSFKSVIWGVVWFLYLANSKQVQRVIPKTFRKTSKKDWGILSGIIILPVFLYCVGYAQIASLVDIRSAQEAELRKTVLASNERTDGRVIFTIPDGFECESEIVSVEGVDITLFSISNEYIGNGNMCADYDTDKSESNFDDYWENWKDGDVNIYGTKDVARGMKQINGNDCLYRITKHNVNGVDVYWRFYLLFDAETGKVFVASLYDSSISANYADELLESVRFK
ncbi:MAG: DUF2569 family protein [Prevotellaceae bacterium]|nr:DUF2569 family protein [Prevotellaceae bacterium]